MACLINLESIISGVVSVDYFRVNLETWGKHFNRIPSFDRQLEETSNFHRRSAYVSDLFFHGPSRRPFDTERVD